jgi:hypothetical protein
VSNKENIVIKDTVDPKAKKAAKKAAKSHPLSTAAAPKEHHRQPRHIVHPVAGLTIMQAAVQLGVSLTRTALDALRRQCASGDLPHGVKSARKETVTHTYGPHRFSGGRTRRAHGEWRLFL